MDLTKQFHLTYLCVRLVLAAASIGLPVVLIVAGWLGDVPLQPTLSNYYFAEFPPATLRSLFVGLLVVIGVLLVVYRGYSDTDNWLHNAAGVAAFAVALFPMECPFAEAQAQHVLCDTNAPRVHYPAAVLLFVIALISIWYGGGKTFRDHAKSVAPSGVRTFDRARAACGAVILSGLLPAAFILLIGRAASLKGWVWWLESLAFWGFGAYWIALTVLVQGVNAKARLPSQLELGPAPPPAPAAEPELWP